MYPGLALLPLYVEIQRRVLRELIEGKDDMSNDARRYEDHQCPDIRDGVRCLDLAGHDPSQHAAKEVSAFKIGGIARRDDMTVLSDAAREDPTYVLVDHAWMLRHKPVIGGYYVVYEDGYASFSPVAAFEAGYTRID